jgi:5-formyltetrahydrofolate cyclo-ligase
LRKNRYGIYEPVGTGEIRVTDIDLVLVPLVAWDKAGGRLGMGASFYDQLFQPFSELARPFRMGVGYGLQNVECIPLDPWDIRLHGILTENGLFTFGH